MVGGRTLINLLMSMHRVLPMRWRGPTVSLTRLVSFTGVAVASLVLRARCLSAALSVVVIGALGAVAMSLPASAEPAQPSCVDSAATSAAATAAAAAALAVRCGKRVEVMSARDETSQVFANPDGT